MVESGDVNVGRVESGKRLGSGWKCSPPDFSGDEASEGNFNLGVTGRGAAGVSVAVSSKGCDWSVEAGASAAPDLPSKGGCNVRGVVGAGTAVMRGDGRVNACRSLPFMLSAANTTGVLPLPSRRLGSAP